MTHHFTSFLPARFRQRRCHRATACDLSRVALSCALIGAPRAVLYTCTVSVCSAYAVSVCCVCVLCMRAVCCVPGCSILCADSRMLGTHRIPCMLGTPVYMLGTPGRCYDQIGLQDLVAEIMKDHGKSSSSGKVRQILLSLYHHFWSHWRWCGVV